MLLDSATNDNQNYLKFYDQHHKYIKLGIHDDEKNRDKLIKLLRFFSTNHKDKLVSLDDYIKEMKEDQKEIDFISGESMKSVEDSPYMENLRAKGYDVLFLTDPIDEYITSTFERI